MRIAHLEVAGPVNFRGALYVTIVMTIHVPYFLSCYKSGYLIGRYLFGDGWSDHSDCRTVGLWF